MTRERASSSKVCGKLLKNERRSSHKACATDVGIGIVKSVFLHREQIFEKRSLGSFPQQRRHLRSPLTSYGANFLSRIFSVICKFLPLSLHFSSFKFLSRVEIGRY